VKFVATKKRFDKKILFHPSLLLLFLIWDPGSGIRDPGSGIQDPEWVKIRIRDNHPRSATLLACHPDPKLVRTNLPISLCSMGSLLKDMGSLVCCP
jgi:hypothetical protein